MSGIAASSPFAAFSTATTTAPTNNGNGQANPPRLGFFARMADRFAMSSLGGIGFGPAANEIKNAFKRLDNNRDSNLDTFEFGSVGNAFGEGAAGFGNADGNHNQQVSLGEFKSWIRGSTVSEFRRVDTNSDGAIDANEFTSVSAANPGLSITGMDTNNDQLVSFREYLRHRVSNFLRP